MSQRTDFARYVVRNVTAQGIKFERRADGAVVVWFKEQPGERPTLYRRLGVIPANEWASVISSLTTEGETGFSFQLALTFHTGGVAYDADAHKHDTEREAIESINRKLAVGIFDGPGMPCG